MPVIEVENLLHPGRTYRADGEKHAAMRAAMLAVLPAAAPRLTPVEVIAAVRPAPPEALFPGRAAAGWWVKCVQLDLEPKGIIRRAECKPVRLCRTGRAWTRLPYRIQAPAALIRLRIACSRRGRLARSKSARTSAPRPR